MDIEEIRKEIDRIDKELVKLLNKRGECALKVGRHKKSNSESIFAPEREVKVFSRALAENTGPLSERAMTAIYGEIISACRALEKPITVVYFGAAGSYTHIASIQRFGESTSFVPGDTIPDVFDMVERKEVDYGVVPVENSTEGIVSHTLDMLMLSDLRICSEVYAPISHNLLSAGTQIAEIKRVYSMPQAIAQCRHWLRNHMPGIEIIEVSSTAKAAQMCREHPSKAAIASSLAAHEYSLNIVSEGIEDNPHNRTRFLVVGYNKPNPSGRDKTSIVFSVPHRAGSLYHALSILDEEGINMTMIESRPTKQMPWEYVFFIDIQGHEKDEAIQRALARLGDHAPFVRVLGSYPEAE